MDDDRRNFLRGNKQHLLYFWHVMDTCDLLLNTLTVLPNEFSASTDGILARVDDINGACHMEIHVPLHSFPISLFFGRTISTPF
jgi:hypothetical protein